MRWFLGLLSLFFFISLSAVAETSLWRVSKGANELYIGGTVHVLSASDYPLPKAYDVAFNKATKLVFETDTEATQDPAFGQSLMSRMMYTDGRSMAVHTACHGQHFFWHSRPCFWWWPLQGKPGK